MEIDPEPRPVYLLTVPWFANNTPSNSLVAALLLPWVLLAYVVLLVPRLILVALLLVLRFLRVVSYQSYMKAPPIINLIVILPALLIFALVTIVFYAIGLLLTLNLMLSGMSPEERANYVRAIVGSAIGTEDY